MKRIEKIDYIEDKTAYCFIDYSYPSRKDVPKALRTMADDFEKYQFDEIIINSRSAYLGFKRKATKEEIEKERDKVQREQQRELNILQCRAKNIGYKLVKQ